MYKIKQEISAGAVVFDYINQSPVIVIYGRQSASQWCLPKGKIELGENPEQAAIREVQEETGIKGEILEPLEDIHYKYIDEKRCLELDKIVHFFLMRKQAVVSEELDPEVESVEWLSIDQALEKLSFESERMVVEKSRQLISEKGN